MYKFILPDLLIDIRSITNSLKCEWKKKLVIYSSPTITHLKSLKIMAPYLAVFTKNAAAY